MKNGPHSQGEQEDQQIRKARIASPTEEPREVREQAKIEDARVLPSSAWKEFNQAIPGWMDTVSYFLCIPKQRCPAGEAGRVGMEGRRPHFMRVCTWNPCSKLFQDCDTGAFLDVHYWTEVPGTPDLEPAMIRLPPCSLCGGDTRDGSLCVCPPKPAADAAPLRKHFRGKPLG